MPVKCEGSAVPSLVARGSSGVVGQLYVRLGRNKSEYGQKTVKPCAFSAAEGQWGGL